MFVFRTNFLHGDNKMNNRTNFVLRLFVFIALGFTMIPVAAYGTMYRTITDKGAFHIRSEYSDAAPFQTISLLKFPNGFTEIIVKGFVFSPYSDAYLKLNSKSYSIPIIGTKNLTGEYKVNELDENIGINLNNAILSANAISIQFQVMIGSNKVIKQIVLPVHVVNEWHNLIQTDIYADCIDGEDLTAISSTYELIQWGCRGDDFYYSFDILNADGTQVLYSEAKSGVELHKFYPSLEAPQLVPGQIYTWKVWSAPSEIYAGKGYEGKFYVPLPDDMNAMPYLSTYSQIQWPARENGDYFYCVDILDSKGKMLYQATRCEDFLHSFSPEQNLELAEGQYRWKVWSSPSYSYGGQNFEGIFSVISYVSTSDLIQWPERANGDKYYCIDILDDKGNMLYRAAKCGEELHSFSNPIKTLKLPVGKYQWIIWSWPSYLYGGENFEGIFSVVK